MLLVVVMVVVGAPLPSMFIVPFIQNIQSWFNWQVNYSAGLGGRCVYVSVYESLCGENIGIDKGK